MSDGIENIDKWRIWKTTNKEIENPQMKKLKIHIIIQKLKDHKLKDWKSTNKNIENPQIKIFQIHKWKIFKFINEKIEKP